MIEKRYTIGDKVYIQRPLVLGQWRQLIEVLEGLAISEATSIPGLVAVIGSNAPAMLAVILTEAGMNPRDKDLVATEDEIAWAIGTEQIAEVIEDFFDVNPTAFIFEKLTGLMTGIAAKIAGDGSTGLSSPLPGVTLPDGTPSCGDTPPTNASPS